MAMEWKCECRQLRFLFKTHISSGILFDNNQSSVIMDQTSQKALVSG